MFGSNREYLELTAEIDKLRKETIELAKIQSNFTDAQLEFYKILSIAINMAKINPIEAIQYMEEQRDIIQQDIAIEDDTKTELSTVLGEKAR